MVPGKRGERKGAGGLQEAGQEAEGGARMAEESGGSEGGEPGATPAPSRTSLPPLCVPRTAADP